MSKVSLTDATSLTNETTFISTLNANYASIKAASDNTLSRDGTSPNSMGAALDMNSYRIINLPAPILSNDPVRLQDITTLTGGGTINAGFIVGPTSPVAGSAQAVDMLWGTTANTTDLVGEAGLWSGKVYSGFGFSKAFTVANNSTSSNLAPNNTMFLEAINNGTNNDVVTLMVVSKANNATGSNFAANFIARNNAGVNGAKLVGNEIDLEFAAGTTAGAGTAGLYINVFSAASAGPAIQTGGHTTGTWTNGIILDGLETTISAGIAPNSGTSMGALVNTGTATYGLDAVVLSNLHKIRLSGTASSHGKIYMDASNYIHIVGGSAGTVYRDKTDSTSWLTIADDGTITTGTGAFKTTGPVANFAFTAIPAGGTAGTGYLLSSTSNFGMFFGSGAPTLSAAKGSLYLRSDGSTTNDRAYINTNGTTTWTALTTAA